MPSKFVELDALDFVGVPGKSLNTAAEASILSALSDASAIVAHAGAARLVIKVVAWECPNKPLLLLSPMLRTHDTFALRLMRAVLSCGPGALLLTEYARSKHRRLKRDRCYVEKQLKFFVGSDAMSDALIEEAQMRICDVRSDRAVDVTAEFLLNAMTPVDANGNRNFANRAVLIGRGLIDRRTAEQMPATVLPGVNAAAMLEAPRGSSSSAAPAHSQQLLA